MVPAWQSREVRWSGRGLGSLCVRARGAGGSVQGPDVELSVGLGPRSCSCGSSLFLKLWLFVGGFPCGSPAVGRVAPGGGGPGTGPRSLQDLPLGARGGPGRELGQKP